MSHLTDLFQSHGIRAEYHPLVIDVLEPDSGLDQLAMIESTLGIVPPAPEPEDPEPVEPEPVKPEPPVQAKVVKFAGHYKDENLVVIAEPRGTK